MATTTGKQEILLVIKNLFLFAFAVEVFFRDKQTLKRLSNETFLMWKMKRDEKGGVYTFDGMNV